MKNFSKQSICLAITQGEIGGAAQYVADISLGLPTDKFAITITHGEKNNEWLGNFAIQNNINFRYLRFVKRNINPIYEILGFFELYKFFKKNNFDIVHLNSNKMGILGALAAKIAGIKKIIFTVHGWAFDDPRPFWERQLYIFLNKWFIKYIDIVISVSEYARQSANSVGIKTDNFMIIHNGIDPISRDIKLTREHAKKLLHEKYNVNVTQFLVSTIANFYPTKGLTYLIEAINKIINQYPQFHFCLIGKGEQQQLVHNYIKDNNLDKNVTIISDLQPARQVLSAFDLFVLPSVKECYPYVILEAMLEGLPIVASNIGGIPEVLKNYPPEQYTLVQPKNSDKLAEAIINQIKTITLNKEMIKNIANKISKEKMIQKTIKIY